VCVTCFSCYNSTNPYPEAEELAGGQQLHRNVKLVQLYISTSDVLWFEKGRRSFHDLVLGLTLCGLTLLLASTRQEIDLQLHLPNLSHIYPISITPIG